MTGLHTAVDDHGQTHHARTPTLLAASLEAAASVRPEFCADAPPDTPEARLALFVHITRCAYCQAQP